MKVQLVGPMSSIEGYNYAAFNRAAELVRANRHECFNPAETFGGDVTYPRSEYMRASIAALLHAECVVLLPGWETSPGSKTELRVALSLGIPTMSWDQFSKDWGET